MPSSMRSTPRLAAARPARPTPGAEMCSARRIRKTCGNEFAFLRFAPARLAGDDGRETKNSLPHAPVDALPRCGIGREIQLAAVVLAERQDRFLRIADRPVGGH